MGGNTEEYVPLRLRRKNPALCREVESLCAKDGEKYIYAYWDQPDNIMHRKGCFCERSKKVLREIEQTAEALSERLSDTLLIITAFSSMPFLTKRLTHRGSIEGILTRHSIISG